MDAESTTISTAEGLLRALKRRGIDYVLANAGTDFAPVIEGLVRAAGRKDAIPRFITVPHWRGIYDDEGRLMVAINFNMDLGDAWEHADDAFYPEAYTGLAYRFAVNYVIYAMTH